MLINPGDTRSHIENTFLLTTKLNSYVMSLGWKTLEPNESISQ